MFERIIRSWQLVRESWRIVMHDKELLAYPVLAAILTVIFAISVFIIPFLAHAFSAAAFIAAFLVVYFGAYIIGVFFNSCIVAVADMHINGKDSTFIDGISISIRNIHRIIIWALISATVGLILSNIRGRGRIGEIASWLLGMAWIFATFFVIPVIIIENKGVIDSTRRSFELFKKTWGESVAGNISISFIFGIAAGFGILLVILASFLGPLVLFPVFAVVFIYWIVLALMSSAMNGVFRTALYNYAVRRKIPKGFSREFVKSAFLKNKSMNRMQFSAPWGQT